ncbi:hypothetical protein [Gemmiger formicilis]|uniref:hypothetical protein n=1 Tax=Gemmiger formicilis TaxID=745368 RepID=UPI00399986D8
MLVGQYDYAIDAKGRLNFPARFRDAMGGDLHRDPVAGSLPGRLPGGGVRKGRRQN